MRKLAIFCASFGAAAAVYIWLLSPLWTAVIGGSLLFVGLISLLFFRQDGRCLRIAVLGAVLGLVWTWGYEQLQILPMRAYVGENVAVRCVACDFAETTDYGCRVTARLDSGRILLYLDCNAQEISPGDRLSLNANVIDVSEGSGREDNLYYQSRDISLLGLQKGALTIEKAEKLPYSAYPVYAAGLLREKIRSIFPDDVQGFALALLTGDRSELTYEQKNDLSISGISHVVAVSGMHVSLILGIILSLFRRKKSHAAVFCLAAMLFFAAMLGFTPSVTRAVIMNSMMLLAPMFRRESDPVTSLSFALWIILLFNPWAIANVSLQLSFAAVAGIFLLTPYFHRGILHMLRAEAIRKKKKRWLLRIVYGLSSTLATTLGATISTAPFVAYHFGTVSLIAPLTNLLTLFLISFLFSFSFVISLFAFVFESAGALAAQLLAWPMRLVLWVVALFSDVPYACLYLESPYVLYWLIFAYLLFGSFLLLRKSCRKRLFAVCLVLSLLGCIWASSLNTSAFRFTVLDVGQGQCTLFQSGDTTVVVDCGGDMGEEGGELLARKLLMQGDRQVEYLILTHFDADHSCGVLQLLSRVEVNCIMVPDTDTQSRERAAITDAALTEGVELIFVREAVSIGIGEGNVRLFPPKDPEEKNASLSALMSYGEYDILITGDMDANGERQLLKDYKIPDIELLVAGHHGSKYSTCEELLKATMPEIVVISVGDNGYGYPTREVLDRVAAIGALVYRTDLHGEISVTR